LISGRNEIRLWIGVAKGRSNLAGRYYGNYATSCKVRSTLTKMKQGTWISVEYDMPSKLYAKIFFMIGRVNQQSGG